jgi:hypothetical protein
MIREGSSFFLFLLPYANIGLKDLEWMNIDTRFTNFTCVLVLKCLNQLAPKCLTDEFDYVINKQLHLTRRATDIYSLFQNAIQK